MILTHFNTLNDDRKDFLNAEVNNIDSIIELTFKAQFFIVVASD